MNNHAVPGLGIAIARHGRIVYDESFGVADRQTGERLTPAHRFRIASISKPITSVAIFTLIERGLLKLDDPVFGRDGVLGHDVGRLPAGARLGAITIEHLLTHSSGGWPNDASDPMFRQPRLDHAGLIDWTLANQPLAHQPGTVFAYSNFGYCLLGRVIEKRTRRPYEAFVRDAVLKPAGVDDMEIAGNTLAERRPLEVRYHGQGSEDPYGLNVRRMDSHGGWLARPAALARFASHVDGFGHASLLRPETIRTMTTASAVNPGYARGWSVNPRHNWWHTGSLPGTATIMVRSSSRLCWAALTNARRKQTALSRDLDALVWTMVRKVGRWRA
jgi:CubicO group peptidase (beta-lactamase class C family)